MLNSGVAIMDQIKIPGENDVFYGGARKPRNHPGNQRFRQMVQDKLHIYADASKSGKSTIISQIIEFVRSTIPRGEFLQNDPLSGWYYKMTDHQIREKISQEFRDALHIYYKSSKTAKKRKRDVLNKNTGSTGDNIQITQSFERYLGMHHEDTKLNNVEENQLDLFLTKETSSMLFPPIEESQNAQRTTAAAIDSVIASSSPHISSKTTELNYYSFIQEQPNHHPVNIAVTGGGGTDTERIAMNSVGATTEYNTTSKIDEALLLSRDNSDDSNSSSSKNQRNKYSSSEEANTTLSSIQESTPTAEYLCSFLLDENNFDTNHSNNKHR